MKQTGCALLMILSLCSISIAEPPTTQPAQKWEYGVFLLTTGGGIASSYRWVSPTQTVSENTEEEFAKHFIHPYTPVPGDGMTTLASAAGADGWELIQESHRDAAGVSIDKYVFKRLSR